MGDSQTDWQLDARSQVYYYVQRYPGGFTIHWHDRRPPDHYSDPVETTPFEQTSTYSQQPRTTWSDPAVGSASTSGSYGHPSSNGPAYTIHSPIGERSLGPPQQTYDYAQQPGYSNLSNQYRQWPHNSSHASYGQQAVHGHLDGSGQGTIPGDQRPTDIVPLNATVSNVVQTQGRNQWHMKPRSAAPNARPHQDRRLDSSFKKRKPSFFRVGRVFKVVWPELAGTVSTGSRHSVVTDVFYGETVYAKIRWFVVVRQGHNSAACLPIQTYGKNGVKPGLLKSEHAIIYTGEIEPDALPGELSNSPNDAPMGHSIRVKNIRPIEVMDERSRVNFGKIYTVEHNVKVCDFGQVHEDDLPWLRYQYSLAWNTNVPDPEMREEEESANEDNGVAETATFEAIEDGSEQSYYSQYPHAYQ